METSIDSQKSQEVVIPPWLNSLTSKYPKNTQGLVLERLTFENFFEHFVDGIAEGRSMRGMIEKDPRNINYARLMRWIRKDPDRLAQFEEAQAIGTELMVEDIISIADGEDSAEDIQRSLSRISTRKWVAERQNKTRYGEVKQTGASGPVINVTVCRDGVMVDAVTVEGVKC